MAEIDALLAEGAAAIPALVAALAEPSWAARRRVVSSLAGMKEAVGALCEDLRTSRSSEARIAAAVDALSASVADADAAVMKLVADPNPAIVADAVQILGRRHSVAALPMLAELTRHRDDNVAVAAIEAVGRIGGRAAVDALVQAVGTGNFFRTFPAIDVLGRSGDPRAVEPLTSLLQDSRYVFEAARALGRTGSRAAAAPLAQLLLHTSDAIVRVAALAITELRARFVERVGVPLPIEESIRALESDAAVRRLGAALGGASDEEKSGVAVVLGMFRNEAALSALSTLLDGSHAVASAAAAALGRIGNLGTEIATSLRDGSSARRLALLPFVGSRLPEVLACLDDEDPAVRALACETIAQTGSITAVKPLFKLLADPDPRVAQAAVGAIQSLGTADTHALALEAGAASDARVRRSAFRILGYFGYPEALPLFREAIRGEDAQMRDAAINGLPFIDSLEARDMLFEVARSQNPRARSAAMRALGQCADDLRSLSFLLKGLQDPDPWARYFACQSLGKAGADNATDAIVARLSDDAPHVRIAAVEALSHLRGDAAAEALDRAARSAEPDVQRAALLGLGIRRRKESLPVLLEAVRAADPATRLVAVSAVADFRDAVALDALTEASRDGHDSVRTAAIGFLCARTDLDATRRLVALLGVPEAREQVLAALSIVSDTRIAAVLADLLAADDERASLLTSVLARMHAPAATDALFQALTMPAPAARRAAATTLGALRTPESTQALKSVAASDPDDEVRRVAALALAQ